MQVVYASTITGSNQRSTNTANKKYTRSTVLKTHASIITHTAFDGPRLVAEEEGNGQREVYSRVFQQNGGIGKTGSRAVPARAPQLASNSII